MAGLTRRQAEAIEAEMRRLEDDPAVTKRELRLFMQRRMPCGHAVGNLLTCDTPPFGCLICLPQHSDAPAGRFNRGDRIVYQSQVGLSFRATVMNDLWVGANTPGYLILLDEGQCREQDRRRKVAATSVRRAD